MNPRICICCGESIVHLGNALSRNPNLCASCSSLTDGMDDSVGSVVSTNLPAGSGGTRTTVATPLDSGSKVRPERNAGRGSENPRTAA